MGALPWLDFGMGKVGLMACSSPTHQPLEIWLLLATIPTMTSLLVAAAWAVALMVAI